MLHKTDGAIELLCFPMHWVRQTMRPDQIPRRRVEGWKRSRVAGSNAQQPTLDRLRFARARVIWHPGAVKELRGLQDLQATLAIGAPRVPPPRQDARVE